jgi:hypothetical protein
VDCLDIGVRRDAGEISRDCVRIGDEDRSSSKSSERGQ